MGDDMGPGSGHPPPTRTTRSRFACIHCQRRKIRCSVSVDGIPCSKCRLDGRLCTTTTTTKPRTKAKGASSWTNKGFQQSSLEMELNSRSLESENQPVNMAKRDPIFNFGQPGLVDDDEDASRFLFSQRVPFSSFPFLKARLSQLSSRDVVYLESQGSLHTPAGHVVKSFLRCYFLYVHPCLPLLDEAAFWRMYHCSTGSDGHFSLLLFQAMLFAASSFISPHTAQMAGYASLIHARDSLYKCAKLLYDFETESSPFCIAQAAILFTYRNTSTEQLANTTWLAVAIQHARAENAHQYDCLLANSRRTSVELKKLWWCCILRDRIISIGVRRPIQITADTFDFTKECLILDDLQDEISNSEVYDRETKITLYKILSSQCRLAVALTVPATVLYGPKHEVRGMITTELEKCKEASLHLASWRGDCMAELKARETDTHRSVLLYAHLTSLYYHASRLALCHRVAFLQSVHQERIQDGNSWSEDCKLELSDAILSITDEVKVFVVSRTASLLPVSAIAYTMFPQILLSINRQLSHSRSVKAINESLLRHYSEITTFYSIRFDMAYILHCIQEFLDGYKFVLTYPKFQTAEEWQHVLSSTPGTREIPTASPEGIIDLEPMVYLRLHRALDFLLSSGKIATEDISLQLFNDSDLTTSESSLPPISSPSDLAGQCNQDANNLRSLEPTIEEFLMELLPLVGG